MHSPHATGSDEESLYYLNINREVTALTSGRLGAAGGGDTLLVGTPSNLQAYNVEENKDLFFKEVGDGVASLAVGTIGGHRQPIIFAGGNCSVQGFDTAGEEVYWTVAGDVVTALAIADVNGDGANELLVGSRDFDIRIFHNEDCVSETTEAEAVIGLSGVSRNRFAYSLSNGTVGVYNKGSRAWRVKSKHQVHSITAFDINSDGVPEIISGWSNGKVEVRSQTTGEVLFREMMSSSVSAVMAADFRNNGTDSLLVCGKDGEVKGYMPMQQDAGQEARHDMAAAQESLVELNRRKNELKMELQRLEERSNAASQMQSTGGVASGQALLPPDTDVTCAIKSNGANSCVDLQLRTNNSTVIRGALVFGEQLFEGESLYVSPKGATSEITIPVRPNRDVPVDVMIKVFVSSSSNSPVYKIFEMDARLSKFCMFEFCDPDRIQAPDSYVQFSVNERVHRIAIWLEDRFNVATNVESDTNQLDACFMHLRTQMPLCIRMLPQPGAPATVWVRTDDMEVAAEIVQDLAGYLGLTELESIAEFPQEMDLFLQVLQTVEDCNKTRLMLMADVAESSNVIKAMVIRAEDARIQGKTQQMKANYRQLSGMNRELIREHEKRATNYSELLAALKEVNSMIQMASRLRVGGPAKSVVAACRQAIKTQNTKTLLKILKSGDAS